jgi:DnaJ-class molecular chaperone
MTHEEEARNFLSNDCPTCHGSGDVADTDFSKSPPEQVFLECKSCCGTGKRTDYDGPEVPGWEGGFAENH